MRQPGAKLRWQSRYFTRMKSHAPTLQSRCSVRRAPTDSRDKMLSTAKETSQQPERCLFRTKIKGEIRRDRYDQKKQWKDHRGRSNAEEAVGLVVGNPNDDN